jgi:hypothetical protein
VRGGRGASQYEVVEIQDEWDAVLAFHAHQRICRPDGTHSVLSLCPCDRSLTIQCDRCGSPLFVAVLGTHCAHFGPVSS